MSAILMFQDRRNEIRDMGLLAVAESVVTWSTYLIQPS